MDGAQKEYKGYVVSAYNVLPESIYEESKEFEGCAVIKAEGLKGEELLILTVKSSLLCISSTSVIFIPGAMNDKECSLSVLMYICLTHKLP